MTNPKKRLRIKSSQRRSIRMSKIVYQTSKFNNKMYNRNNNNKNSRNRYNKINN